MQRAYLLKQKQKRSDDKGNMTIETACIMPLMLSVTLLLIYFSVFEYNISSMEKIACIGIHKGLQMEHDSAIAVQNEIESYLEKQLKERILFSSKPVFHVKVSMTSITIEIELCQNVPFTGLSEIMQKNAFFAARVKKKANRLDPAKIMWLGE